MTKTKQPPVYTPTSDEPAPEPALPRVTPSYIPTSSTSSRTKRPSVTLDTVVYVLANSIFHPWIVFVFILSTYATHRHKGHPLLVKWSFVWLWVLCLAHWLAWWNHKLVHGNPRKVIWKAASDPEGVEDGKAGKEKTGEEVVVITGGGSGLGRCLVEMLLAKGAKVAVLDVEEPDVEMMERWAEETGRGEDWEVVDGGTGSKRLSSGKKQGENGRRGLSWYVCDAGKAEEVDNAVKKIVQEVGPPTILINNAAAAINGRPLFAASSASKAPSSLTIPQIQQTINVNLVSHFNTLTVLLPLLVDSPHGATIVTISSILAHLSPASLSDYVASKSAVTSLHHTLQHEIAQTPGLKHKIKTILVEPGQMATPLFAHARLPWYASFLGPTLDGPEVAKEILKLLDRGDGGVLRMPFYAKVTGLTYGALPESLQLFVRWLGGVDSAFGPAS